MQDNETKKWLYDSMKSKGYDLGSYEEFDAHADEEETRKWLYDNGVKSGLELGSYEEFDAGMGKNIVSSSPEMEGSTSKAGPKAQEVTGEYDSFKRMNAQNEEGNREQVVPSPYVGKDDSGRITVFGVPYDEYQNMPKEEQSKVYSKAIKDRKDQELKGFTAHASDLKASVNSELKEVMDLHNAEEKSYAKEHPVLSFLQGFGQAQTGGRNQRTIEANPRYRNLMAAANLLKDSENRLAEASADKSSSISNFGRGVRDKALDVDTWTAGFSKLADNTALLSALDKANKQEQLTSDEEKLLDALVTNLTVNAYTQSDISRGYQIGETTAYSLPFMLEFIANPIASSGNVIAKKLLTYGLKKFGKAATSKAAKVAGRLTGDIVAATGMTATTSLPRVAADTAGRLADNYTYDVDDNGELVVNKTGNTSFVGAAAKSAASRLIENQSEMIFNAFRGTGGMLWGTINKVMPEGVSSFFRKAANLKPVEWFRELANNETMREVAKRAQFHGIGEEYLEEVYNNFANIPLGEMTFEEAINLDNNITTFLSLAPTQIGFSLLGLGSMAVNRYSNRKKMRALFEKMTPEQQAKLTELTQMSKERGNEDIKKFIEITIADKDLTTEQKKDEIEYAFELAKQNAIEDLQQEQTPEGRAADDAYIQGTELPMEQRYSAEQERVAAEEALREIDENALNTIDRMLADDASANEIEEIISGMDEDSAKLARDYYNKSMRINGIVDSARDDAEEAVASFEASLQEAIIPDAEGNGTITTATLMSGAGEVKEEVYVIANDGVQATILQKDGTKKMVNSGLLDNMQTSLANDVVQLYQDRIGEQMRDQTDMSLNHHPKTRVPQPGMQIWNGDMSLIITEVNADGSVRAFPAVLNNKTGLMEPKNGSTPVDMSVKESLDLQDDYYNKMDVASIGVNLSEKEGKNAIVSRDEESKVSGKEAVQISKGRNISEEDMVGRGLTEDEAGKFVMDMELNAETAPEIELTPENWIAEFGSEGILSTPLGNVKMGNNQYLKLSQQGRNGKLGMIKPTLTNPDVIIEDESRARNGEQERDSSYVFVKAFTDKNGKRIYYFTSVTVKKGGNEVVISNQEKGIKRISKLLQNGKVAWIKPYDSLHPTSQEEKPVSLDETNGPTSNGNQPALLGINSPVVSENKDTQKSSENQEVNVNNSIQFDEKGNPLYHKAPVETTVAYLSDGSLTDEEIDLIVAANQAEANKQLEKIIKDTPKIVTNKEKYVAAKKNWQAKVDDARQQSEYWKEVASFIKQQREQPGDKITEEILSIGEPLNELELAAQKLANGSLPLLYEDYKRELGFSNEEAGKMFGLFKSRENGGLTVEEAGEVLMQNDLEEGTNFFDQEDANAGRNAILEVLSSARTRGDLIEYIRKKREAASERERRSEEEYDEEQREAWAQENFGMSYADYVTFEEVINDIIQEKALSKEAIQEFYDNFADEFNNWNNGRITEETTVNERGSVGSRSESSEGLLPTEQLSDNRGIETDISAEADERADNKGVPASEESIITEIETAREQVDTNPSDAQKEAGNYKKGHIKLDGYDITIENPKGSERSGTDADGNKWSITMNNDYGYIRGTESIDGDHIDIFLSDNPAEGNVYVIDQLNTTTGEFDEHKVMYGFSSMDEATQAYLSNYSPGWQGLGAISEVSKDEFKKWIDSSHRKTKPFADYKSVKVEEAQNQGKTEVKLPQSKSNAKNKKRAADIKQARYELMDAKRELSVAQATNSGYTPEEVEEKKKRVEEAESKLKDLTNKVPDENVASATDNIGEFSTENDDIRFRIVHHGTGASFDKFTTEKIGTGEGNAAFGWGLYFTEKKDIAMYYANMLGSGLQKSHLQYELERAKERLPYVKGDVKKDIESHIQYLEKQIVDLQTGKHLYDVEIPDDGYINWDKVIPEEQKKQIQDQAEKEGLSFSFYGDAVSPKEYFEKAGMKLEGFQLYKSLTDALGSDKAASLFLNRAGFNGIEYEAGRHSANKKGNEMNFVVFDENAVRIIDHLRYRLIGEQETANLDKVPKQREIIQTVEDLSDKLNTPIHIARSLDEIPDGSAKRAIEEERKVKAWFDTGTREVFFYIPNATDVNDAKVSILHEVVGHKGLRNLFGTENETKFDSMMMDLFEKLPLNVRSEIADMAVSIYANNVSVAMDEYLAEQAEKDETPGWWDRIVSAIRDFFRKMGVDVKLSENDVKYLLWRSRKKLETGDLFEQAKDVVMRNKLGIGLNETQETSKSAPTESTRFRIVGGIFDSAGKDVEVVERETGNAREMYDRTLQTAGYKRKESWQDSMLGLKEAQDAIAKATHSRILDYENAYMAENALSSRSLAEINAYRELVYKPILEEIAQMKKQGAKYEDISDYLITKHGIERNREMAVRKALAEDEDTVKENIERWTEDKKNIWNNGSMSWKEKQEELDRIATSYGADMSVDYSGLSAMFPNDDMAETTAEAYKAVEGFEEKFETAPLLDKVKAATTATLDKQRDSGLMNKDTYKSIQDMYQFYVPLRGWEEKTADEVYDYITSETPVFNAPLKTAKGRTSKSDDPLPTIANIAESGILQGNRNLMKQKFLTMVENHRSNLVSVSELWVKYDAVNDKWIAIFPEIPNNASAEEVENIVSQFNARMEELSKNNPDEYKKASDARDIPYKILPKDLKEHQVIVKRNGKEYVLTINGNPRAAQALNGLTNPNATNSPIIKLFESTNRFLAANFTQRNPAFVISNMFRDGFYSNSVIWVKESPLYAKKYNKNWAKSFKEMGGLVKRYKTNSLDMNNDTDRMFLEFINNGGETGYTFINSVEEYKGIIAKELKKQNRSKLAPGTAFDILGEAMDTFGRWAEDTSRFAAYRTSREMGRSIARSISDAKEISVNFNKKGSGAKTAGQWEKGNRLNALQAWTSQTARGLYIFWNAGVQGLTNFARLAKRNPGKFAGLASSYFVLGTMIPIINAAIASAMGGDGDEDDYYNLPEYVRRNNICIYVGGEWITMPLPIELRAIYGLGELASGLLSGKENMTGWKLTKKIAEQVSQIMPIDMMEGGGGFSAFVPSYVKPAYEVWTNKDWTGIPIYRKNDFNKNMPEWTKAYSSTSPELVKLSEIINEWTGGTKYKTGMIDFNPAIVEHLFESYLGGVGTTINQLKKTLMMPFNEDLQELRNAPVISRFMRSADSRSVQKRIDEEYFNNRNRFELIQQEVNGYKKELNNPQTNDFDYAKYQTLYNKMINSDEYRKYIEFKEMDKVLKRMRDEFKQSGNEELEAQMFLLKEAMNEVAK